MLEAASSSSVAFGLESGDPAPAAAAAVVPPRPPPLPPLPPLPLPRPPRPPGDLLCGDLPLSGLAFEDLDLDTAGDLALGLGLVGGGGGVTSRGEEAVEELSDSSCFFYFVFLLVALGGMVKINIQDTVAQAQDA